MKKSDILSTVAGVGLFVLAAVFSISLLLVLPGVMPADTGGLYRMGTVFASVYGWCSVLIPAFLIAAGVQCFNPQWDIKRGVILLGSVVPFFTADALEHVCRIIVAGNVGAELGIKLTTALLIGAVVFAVEYFLLAMLGDTLQHILMAQIDERGGTDADNMPGESEEIEDNAEDENHEIIVEDDDFENDEDTDASENEIIRAPTTLANGEDNPFNHVFDIVENKENDAAAEPEVTASETSDVDEAYRDTTFTNDAGQKMPLDEPFTEDASAAQEAPEEDVRHFVLSSEETEALLKDLTAEEKEESDETDSESEAAIKNEDDELYLEEAESSPSEADIKNEKNDEASEEPVMEDAPPLNEASFPPPVPHYNENAPQFVSDEEEPEELVELDEAFNPAEDSFAPAEPHAAEELDTPAWLAESISVVTDEELGYELTDDDMISEEEAAILERADQEDGVDEHFDDIADYEPVMDTDDDVADSEPSNLNEASLDEAELVEVAVPQKLGLEAIFAEMDDDAAHEPVFADEDEVVVPVVVPAETVDPLAPPVVDAHGQPFAQPAPVAVAVAEHNDEPVLPQPDADDFPADDERVVRLEKPAPLVEEPKIERQRIRGPYRVPSDLLDTYANGEYWVIDEETQQAASDLKDTLSEFKIEAEVTGIRKGPVVTMFEILPAPGVKLSKIVTLQDNIALRLAASSVRIVAPIPGKHAVGIEVPNKERAVVSFKEIVDLDLPQFNKMAIPVILGKDISGEPRVLDLAKTPHLLIAGSTGAGKSVCVNSMILSILYKRSPQDVKLIMIDPKVVELKLYNDIPHLLTPVITESKRAFQSLQYCLCEMERRYACLDGMGVRDIASYNKRIVERNIAAEKLPYIVVIIDEFADLMATTGKELESTIARLAAMSRAVGIHLVLATQRPSIDVITGLIKANIPSRIAFMVASKMDSRIIIDQVGAEKLLGKGDMLFASATDPFPVRIQGTLVNDNEVENVVEYVKRYGEPEYIDDEIFVDDDDDGSNPGLFSDGDDPLYDEALQIVMQAGKASASYIQRRLKIGYNRAARLVEEMEERGIVGPANGSKPREVICVP